MAVSTDDLIKEAYAVVAKPERLMLLQQMLDEDLAGRDLSDRVEPEIAAHFDRATHLLEELTPGVGSDFAKFADENVGNTQKSYDLLLDNRLKITECDDGIFTDDDFTRGKNLPDWAWSETEVNDDRNALRDIAKAGEGQHTLRLRQTPDMARGSLFLATHLPAPLTSARRSKSGGMVALRSLPMRYDEASAEAFARAFGLSAAESDIVRQIVDGGTLRALAAERGTAVGTVRNQLKGLLQKLSLNSQIDLVCLYAGFRQSRLSHLTGKIGGQTNQYTPRIVNLREHGKLPVQFYGPVDGTPILFLHPAYGGAFLTHDWQALCERRHLRIIAPWRPHFGRDDGQSSSISMVQQFCNALSALLDKLDIDKVNVLGASGGTPYAFGFARQHPDRVIGMTIAGAAVPIATRAEMGMIGLSNRLPLQLARYAPAIARYYVRAWLAKLHEGGKDNFIERFFQDSSADMALARRADFGRTFREALRYSHALNYKASVEELILNSADWSELAEGVNIPVTLLSGETDRLAPTALVRSFAARHGFTMIGPVAGVGSFLLFQRPELVCDTILRGPPTDQIAPALHNSSSSLSSRPSKAP